LAGIMLTLTVIITLDTVHRWYVLLVKGATQSEEQLAAEESA
jgi:hypothetical protein